MMGYILLAACCLFVIFALCFIGGAMRLSGEISREEEHRHL